MSLPQQLLALAFTVHKATILLFGYFIPALSSVKGELETVALRLL